MAELSRGQKAKQTKINKLMATGLTEKQAIEKYNAHLRLMASKGGKKSNNGGFASEKVGFDGLTGRERASISGTLSGKSKRIARSRSSK